MAKRILSQNEEDVKSDAEECKVEGCHEYVLRGGLCLLHYVEEETVAWDDEDAEREMVLECVGYSWGDPMGVLT